MKQKQENKVKKSLSNIIQIINNFQNNIFKYF